MKGDEVPSAEGGGDGDVEPEKVSDLDPIAYERLAMNGNDNPTSKIMNFRTTFYGQAKDVEET